jgi:hypothetical protein
VVNSDWCLVIGDWWKTERELSAEGAENAEFAEKSGETEEGWG